MPVRQGGDRTGYKAGYLKVFEDFYDLLEKFIQPHEGASWPPRIPLFSGPSPDENS